jgi:hypothetical protein
MSQTFSSILKNLRNFGAVGIVVLALVACGEGGSTPPSNTPTSTNSSTNTTQPTTNNSTNSANPAPAGTVVNRIEKSGAIDYKIYLQQDANGSNRKGIVLLGSGNDENNPVTGSLDGGLENTTASELAKLGYVVAIVAYRDQPAINFADGGVSWNNNSVMLGMDMSNVADTIITTYGNGLARGKVISGGVSYTSYMLLTNIALSNALADTRGVLATCGSTGADDAKNFKVPVYSLACSGNPEGNLEGQALIDQITNPQIKADSGFFIDPACNTHCGGDTNTWTAKMVERVQTWLP